jgi:hypothetical protein
MCAAVSNATESRASLSKRLQPFVCGGLASMNAEVFTFPIDLVKTRLQIQGQRSTSLHLAVSASSATSGGAAAIQRPLKYRGMLHCFTLIVKEEGLASLYCG